MMNTSLNFCTIISKNYLASARVLARSIRRYHPDASIYVLLVDRLDGYFDPKQEPFELFLIDELPIPELTRFCFQYNILELNTAAKPYFLKFLFDRFQMCKLVYLDPDIQVYQPMVQLDRVLNEVSIVLTPHLLTPYQKNGTPSELNILFAGAYNLGFIGLSNKEACHRLLKWWQEKLYRECLHQADKGYMVDQKWIDLVPCYFEDISIFREDNYNVAYWNLHERELSYRDEILLVNGRPCVFFHFSGYNPYRSSQISKYQTRFEMKDLKEGSLVYNRYAQELFREDYKDCIKWPYAFNYFDNGRLITPTARELYRALGDSVIDFGDPFRTSHENSFFSCHKYKEFVLGPASEQGINLIGMFHSEKGTYDKITGKNIENELQCIGAQIDIINSPIISHRPLIGSGLACIRKIARWFVKPALERQTKVNNLQFTHLKTLIKKTEQLEREVEELQHTIKSITSKGSD
jgi:hypothetical protein